jgi:hypothetical protein
VLDFEQRGSKYMDVLGRALSLEEYSFFVGEEPQETNSQPSIHVRIKEHSSNDFECPSKFSLYCFSVGRLKVLTKTKSRH